MTPATDMDTKHISRHAQYRGALIHPRGRSGPDGNRDPPTRRPMTQKALITAAAGGLLALFRMYWDDSLHTDAGGDAFWSAPHLLLHGSLTIGCSTSLACWTDSSPRPD